MDGHTSALLVSAVLQHAKTRREAIGVELYNFQQQLAKMQMQLEKAQENYAHISQIRCQAEEQLQRLQTTHAEEEQLTSQERLKVMHRSLSCLAPWYQLNYLHCSTLIMQCANGSTWDYACPTQHPGALVVIV